MTASRCGLLALVAACSTATADPDSPSQRFERDMALRFHMHQNFDLVRGIERLLIRGKLDDAKRFAEAIAFGPDEPAHGPWAAHLVTVRERAADIARAPSVEIALRKETQLAAACAACHREHTVGLFGKPAQPPPDRPTLDARMLRHRWAADRLWEGVVGDADDAWDAGLDVLTATPLDLGPARAPFAQDLQRIATTARRTKRTSVDRATTYGDLLVTCAGCHAAGKP